TPALADASWPLAVHPRTCGEHWAGRCRARVSLRFIPAPAGNTRVPIMDAPPMPVHPRTCGEHVVEHNAEGGGSGSSPHLRGTPLCLLGGLFGLRFIPAPAGNTSPQAARMGWAAVHPRTCGEHSHLPPGPVSGVGSSPHLRGTHRAR